MLLTVKEVKSLAVAIEALPKGYEDGRIYYDNQQQGALVCVAHPIRKPLMYDGSKKWKVMT